MPHNMSLSCSTRPQSDCQAITARLDTQLWLDTHQPSGMSSTARRCLSLTLHVKKEGLIMSSCQTPAGSAKSLAVTYAGESKA